MAVVLRGHQKRQESSLEPRHRTLGSRSQQERDWPMIESWPRGIEQSDEHPAISSWFGDVVRYTSGAQVPLSSYQQSLGRRLKSFFKSCARTCKTATRKLCRKK